MIVLTCLVLRVQIALVQGKKREAHRVITTAVQQASQIVEIQGAPSAVLAGGDEFRVTLAASVSNATAQNAAQTAKQNAAQTVTPTTGQKAGRGEGDAGSRAVSDLVKLASAKSFQAGLTAKNTAGAAGGKATAAVSGSRAAENGEFPEAATAAISATGVRGRGNLALSGDAAVGTAEDVSAVKNDVRWAVLTPATDEAQGAGAANAKGRVSGAGLASATTSKNVGSSEVHGAVGTEVAKSGAAGAGKQLNPAKVAGGTVTAAGAEGVSSAVPVTIQPTVDTRAIAQSGPASASDIHSIAKRGTIAAVVTTVPEATDGADSVMGGTFHPLNADAGVSGRDAASSPQGDVLPISEAIDGGAKAGPGKLTQAGENGPGSGDAGGHGNARVLESAETRNTSETNSTSGAGGVAVVNGVSQDAGGSAIPKARAIATSQAGSATQTLGSLRPATAKAAGTAQKPPSNAATKDVELVGAGVGKAGQASLNGITASGGAAIAQASPARPEADGVARDVVPMSAPAREASSKPELGAAKDGKTKIAAAADMAPGGTVAGQSVNATAAAADGSVTASAAAGASGNGAAGRAVVVADPSAPTLTVPQAAGPPVHAGASNGSSAPARTLSAVSAGSLVESPSAVGQVVESHRTLLATPTTLEVGVQSGTQGWLRIRAEVGDQGAVNASLTASSSGGRELLHSQAPALNAFLHGEQMAVTTTVVDRGAAAGGTHGGGTVGSGGLSGQDGSGGSNSSLLHGGGAQGDAAGESSQPARSSSRSDTARGYDPASGVREAEGASAGRGSSAGESGRWLNVRV